MPNPNPITYEGELTNVVTIDVQSVPDYVRDNLADTMLQGFRRFMAQPGSRELLDAKKNAPGQSGA